MGISVDQTGQGGEKSNTVSFETITVIMLNQWEYWIRLAGNMIFVMLSVGNNSHVQD